MYVVFDINKPLFDAEVKVNAKNPIEAIKQVITLKDNEYIKATKHGGRFVVYKANQGRIYRKCYNIYREV